MNIEALREKLLLATLPHVAFDGWTPAAIRAGAREAAIEWPMALNAFPEGAAELIEYFSRHADQRMLEELERRDLAAMRVRDRVAAGVRVRLEQVAPHREAVHRGLSYFALPTHGPLGLKCLYRTVDAIWYAAGDTSTDYNYYTKRMLLAGVYSTTLMFWLNDRSEDSEETWAFLDRRIDEVMRIGGSLGKAVNAVLDLPDRLVRLRPFRGGAVRR